MIKVMSFRGQWIIALNPQSPLDPPVTRAVGNPMRRSRPTRILRESFDGCWTGDGWSRLFSNSLKFDSNDDAQIYLEENSETIQ